MICSISQEKQFGSGDHRIPISGLEMEMAMVESSARNHGISMHAAYAQSVDDSLMFLIFLQWLDGAGRFV